MCMCTWGFGGCSGGGCQNAEHIYLDNYKNTGAIYNTLQITF